MNKKLTKIVGITLGLSMAVGAGAGIAITNNTQTSQVEASVSDATAATAIISGRKYLVTAVYSDTRYYLTPYNEEKTAGNVSATAIDNVSNATESLCWTFTGSGTSWSISANGFYLANTDTNNGVKTQTSSQNWTSSFSGSNLTLTGANSRKLALYQGNNWRCYTSNSGVQSLQIYEFTSGGAAIDPESIELNETSLSMFIGNAKQLTASLEPDNATGTISWVSSATGVATVSNGKVTAIAAGNATITAFIDEDSDGQVDNSEISASCSVTVTQGSLADFNNDIKGDKVDFFAYYVGKYSNASKGYFVSDGETGAYIYDPAPDGVNVNDILHIKGTIDVYNGLREITNTTIVKVDSHAGLVTPVTLELDESALSSFGVADQGRKATITGRVTAISGTANYGNNTLTYTITVGSKTISTILHKTWITEAEYNDFVTKAQQGKEVTIEAYVGAYKSGTTDLSQLTASNYELLNPKVTAVQAETLTGVELDKTDLTLLVNDSVTLALSPVPGGAVLGAVTWQSSDEDVATVEDGTVTAVGIGSATITASSGGFSDTCDIEVVDGERITLSVDDFKDGGVTGTAGAQTLVVNGLQIDISNGLASDNVRVYKNATLTFSAQNIYKIKLTCTASGSAQYGPGSFGTLAGYSYSGVIGTWEGNSDEVQLTASNNQARFTEVEVTYRPDNSLIHYDVTFNSLGGGDFDPETVSKGSCIDPLPTPTKAKNTTLQKKYAFEGWYTSNAPFQEQNRFTSSTPVNSDLTLYANYTETNYYIVTFNSKGGSAVASQEVDSGETIEVPTDPTKAADASNSYVFDEWCTDEDCNTSFDVSTPITGNITLYAKYTSTPISNPADYVNTANSIATIHGRETGGEEVTVTKTVASVSGTTTNQTQVAELHLDSNITVSVNPDGNNGKVYDNGAEWRLYQFNSAVVNVAASGDYRITSVEFTFTAANGGTLEYNSNALTSETAVTINSLASVNFVVGNSGEATNGQIKITNIEVTYASPKVVDNVVMRFGATFSKSAWEAIRDHDGWELSDYGVMLMKKTDLDNSPYLSVEDAFDNNASSSILKIINKRAGGAAYADPYLDGDEYLFTVRVSFPDDSQYYDDVIYAVPFIVVNDTYYFLDEMNTCVRDLAYDYYGTGYEYLSDAALEVLAS